MKKTKKYFLVAIIIILALFNLNTVMNILTYNTTINIYTHYNDIDYDEVIRTILIIIFNFIISLFFATIISKLLNIKTKEENNDDVCVNRRARILISVLYLLSFIIFNGLFYFKYTQNITTVIFDMVDYTISGLLESYVMLGMPSLNIWTFVLSSIAIIPSIVKLNIPSRNMKKKKTLFKIINRFATSVLILTLLICNAYLYINIPEFEYAYFMFESENEKYIQVLGYSNYMENFIREIEMPDKILNKEVFFISGISNGNMYISSNISWEGVKNIFKTLTPTFDANYIMVGESKDWLIENNQLFNKDKTEMIIRQVKDQEHLYIPDTVEKIGDALSIIALEKDVIVDEKNEKYFSYDGNFYANISDKADWNTLIDFDDELEETNESNIIWCISPKNKENIKLKDDISGQILLMNTIENNTVIIPDTLISEISLINLTGNLVVEDDNPLYSAIDGDLYNKDATMIISINYDKQEYRILPSVKEFSLSTLSYICTSDLVITLDENNENFIYENNILYNKDKTKVIFTKINKMSTEPIDSSLEIDETFKKVCEESGYEIIIK